MADVIFLRFPQITFEKQSAKFYYVLGGVVLCTESIIINIVVIIVSVIRQSVFQGSLQMNESKVMF